MKTTFGTISLIVFTLILTACGGGGGGGGHSGGTGNTSKLSVSKLNIEDAQMLFLTSEPKAQISNVAATTKNKPSNDGILSSHTKLEKLSSDNQALGESSDEQEVKTLYKMTKDGLIVEVEIFDEDGKKLDQASFPPSEIRNLNENYVLFSIDFGSLAENGPAQYLVHKSTGSAYFWWGHDPDNEKHLNVQTLYSKSGWHVSNPSTHFPDSNGNLIHRSELDGHVVADGKIYLNVQEDCTNCQLNWVNRIYQLEDNDPAHLFIKSLSPDADSVHATAKMMVDNASNVFYPRSEDWSDGMRIIKPSGALMRAAVDTEALIENPGPSSFISDQLPFLNDKGKVSLLTRTVIWNGQKHEFDGARLFDINTNDGSITTLASLDGTYVSGRSPVIRAANKIFFLGAKGYGSIEDLDKRYLIELNTSANTLNLATMLPEEFDGDIANEIPPFAYNNNVLYLGDDKFQYFRIDLTDYSIKKVLDSSKYEISKITAAPNGDLIGAGLRLSDGEKVIIQVNDSGNIEVLDEFNNQTVLSLLKII